MEDPFKKHRVIGIRHTLKPFKEAGLVENETLYPDEAVENVQCEMKELARTWYETGAKRGGIEVLNAFLSGKFKVKRNGDGTLIIVAKINNVSWWRRLIIKIGNDVFSIKRKEYQLTLEDLEFNLDMS